MARAVGEGAPRDPGRYARGAQQCSRHLQSCTYLALNRTDDARTTVEQALARNLDAYYLRLALYDAAFLRGDQQTMQQQLAWAAGRSGEEDWLLSAQSDTEAYFGRLGKAREFSQRAVESARRADSKETAALRQANGSLHEAELGNAGHARQQGMAALALMPGKDVKSVAALALARAGDRAQAQKLAQMLNKEFPQATAVQGYWLPSIRVVIGLARRTPARRILQNAMPYELSQTQPYPVGRMYPAYLRGQAYLLARQGKEAQFSARRTCTSRSRPRLRSPGRHPKSPRRLPGFPHPLERRRPDIPILQQAKAEYAKLK